MPQFSDTYIQTQFTIGSDAYMGAHDLVSYGLYQITIHHVNTDVKNKDDSQSFETQRGNHCSYSCFW